MHLSDFDYLLPSDLIAQHPAGRRDASRMMVVDRTKNDFVDDEFGNFARYLKSGDVLVLNNTRVFPARLFGVSETGAQVEIFLVTRLSDTTWEALARPARRLRSGKHVTFGTELSGQIVEQLREGRVRIEFSFDGDFDTVLDQVGQTPLPPYIERDPKQPAEDDRERYQTLYARHRGAIAAPTAGLHFTPAVFEQVEESGAVVAQVTLHVGYGTFEPVRTSDLSQHSVMAERYEIDAEAADVLERARREQRRIVAVGTTTTRTLEYALARHGRFVPEAGTADLTITPGYRFNAIRALLTNFHLPQSSLLILVSTFGGHKFIMDAYRHAVEARYRFYSYGDCMFIT
jgi:S-adenosylmethionine:tRNA ribosyltransferase-isomerase